MTVQLTLDGTRTTGANGRPLTSRQQLAWDYVTSIVGGCTVDEVGAWLHAHRGRRPHSVDVRCEFCATAGRDVLESAALKPLLIRRRCSRKYEPREPADRAKSETVQTVSLPGSTFADIFGVGEVA